MEYASKFEELLHQHLTGMQFNALPEQLGYTSNKFSRLMNNPGVASNTELIFFAQLLQLAAWHLYSSYGLGVERLSALEATYHQWIAESHTKEPTLPYNAQSNTLRRQNEEPARNRGKDSGTESATTRRTNPVRFSMPQ